LNCASEPDDDGNAASKNPRPPLKPVVTLVTQYEALSAKADTREKWEKLGEFAKKGGPELTERYEKEFELWSEAILTSDNPL